MDKGNIIITPFKKENLSTSSYDVSLGEYFYREQGSKKKLYNLYSENTRNIVWGDAEKSVSAVKVFETYKESLEGISPNDQVILISPGETILAHTQEFIGGQSHITTMMKSRSSMGRSFINSCKCAGWGDVGFINRWTLEITNFSVHYYIPLVVGRRIAQIVFFDTGPVQGNYALGGKYQQEQDLQTVQDTWSPDMMLPRLHIDRDIQM